MAELTSSSAYDVKIESVLITSDRLQNEFEIAANVVEINIFENIDLPYLTANMLVVDSSELFTRIGFQGTENVVIRTKINGDDTSQIVEKEFIVTNLKIVPAQDTAETILVNMIEKIGWLDNLITVSKAYDGKPEEIIAKIIKDNLETEILVPKDFNGSALPPMKVVIPNISPLKAARWVKDRLITSEGMPFFLYSTLNGKKLFLTDLGYMLSQPARNDTRPYMYGQSFNRYSSSKNVYEQARNIENYKLPSAENMYGLISNGTVSSTYDFIDPVKPNDTRFTQIKVSMEDVLDRMVNLGLITPDQRGPIYDDLFTVNDKTIDEYNPSVLTQITPSNTFTSFSNYYESESVDIQKLKAISRSLRWYLLKSPIEIVMPGFDFLGRGENITIGTQIAINFLKNDPSILQTNDDVLDKKRTGKYLIYACRHIIRPEKYSVVISGVKLANIKS